MDTNAVRVIGGVLFFVLLITAVTFSTRDRGLPEGASGSYLGRSVMDGKLSADRERELGARIGRQRY